MVFISREIYPDNFPLSSNSSDCVGEGDVVSMVTRFGSKQPQDPPGSGNHFFPFRKAIAKATERLDFLFDNPP